MAELSERHEVRVRGQDQTIVIVADSEDGRLVIRQEPDGKKTKDVCSITLADPDELRLFFKGLRRMLASLGYADQPGQTEAPSSGGRQSQQRALPSEASSDDREAVVAQARQKNPQAFAPWSKEEEQQVRQRHKAGESIQSIARAHKRSPRAIELRLQKLGSIPSEEN